MDHPGYAERVDAHRGADPADVVAQADPTADDLFLLLFTSGTTGAPKAVRCTQGRLASIALRSAEAYGFDRDDVAYCAMPLFHGNALMVLWGPTLVVGATVALARRFSASGFLPDVRRYGATTFTYVGKALAYVLATPAGPDDADCHAAPGLRHRGLGGRPRRLRGAVRLRADRGVRLERGGGGHQPGPGHPDRIPRPPVRGRGRRRPGHAGGVPPAEFDAGRGAWSTATRRSGEIVNRSGPGRFEGYYADPEATAERTAERLVLDRRPGLPRRRTAASTSPGAAATGCGSTRRT